jgi:hypothetical protein
LNGCFWPVSDRGSSFADSPADEYFATVAGRPDSDGRERPFSGQPFGSFP